MEWRSDWRSAGAGGMGLATQTGAFFLESIFLKPYAPMKRQVTGLGQGTVGSGGPLDCSGDSEKASCRSWHRS